MWTKRLTSAGLLLLFWVVRSVGAQPIQDDSDLAVQFRVGPVYTQEAGDLAVVVQLPYGVASPDPSNFKLRFDESFEVPATSVKTFLASGQELAWLVCVDTSGSMAGGPLDDAKAALLTVFSHRTALRIGLLTFHSKVTGPKFMDSRQELTAALERLRPAKRGVSKLYQALYAALDFYEEASEAASLPPRRRILVISDGMEQGSAANAESVIKHAAAVGIPIDAIARGKKTYPYSELGRIAAGTGGRFIDAKPDQISLTDALTRIYRELMETQTVVAYFQYRSDHLHEPTDKAAIELKRSGAPSLSANLGASIPAPVVETPSPSAPPTPVPMSLPASKPSTEGWWHSWLLAGSALVLLLAALLMIARRFAKPRDDTETAVSETSADAGHEDVGTYARWGGGADIPASIPEQPRKTLVGGSFPAPRPGAPAAVLVGVAGAVQGLRFPIEKESVAIGADAGNDLAITGDGYVSGSHAVLRYENGNLLIQDRHSRNGTFVNETRLALSAQLLMPGDVIRMGSATFKVAQ